MPIKNFLILVVRLMGLYILLFNALPKLINSFVYLGNWNADIPMLWLFFTLLFPLLISLALIFKAEAIVRILRLENGLIEGDIKTSYTQVLQTAFIILGGVLIANNISYLLSALGLAVRSSFHTGSYMELNVDLGRRIVATLIGVLILSNYNWLALKFQKDKPEVH